MRTLHHHHVLALRRRRGMALMLVLFALALAVVIGLGFLVSSSTATPLARIAESRLQARLAAESGLAIALRYIQTDPDWRTLRSSGLWVQAQPVPGGLIDIYGEDGDRIDANGNVVGDGDLADDPQDLVVLTCVASAGEARVRLRTIVTPALPSTLAVKQRITVRDQALIDSYNSSSGEYGSENEGATAAMSSNDIGRPNVILRGNAQVNGNVYVGPDGDPGLAVQVLNAATLNGSRGVLGAVVPVPPLTVPTMVSSIGNLSYSSGAHEVRDDLHCDNLTLTGTALLQAKGDVRILVEGPLTIDRDAVIDFSPPSLQGLATQAPIIVYGSARVDAFDSSKGGYGGANSGLMASLATNATTSGAVSVSAATVVGHLYSGAGSDPSQAISVTGSGTVTGRQEALGEAVPLPPPPPWPDLGPSVGSLTRDAGTQTLDSSIRVDALHLNSSGVLRVSGHRTLRIDGDMEVGGGARLEITPNSSLRVYVGGAIKFSGSARINANTEKPSLLTIYGMNGGVTHDLTGNASEVYASIYAPNATLQMSGNAQLFGAFGGGSVSIGGTSQFHHDWNPAVAAGMPQMPTVDRRLTIYTRGPAAIGGSARLNPTTGDADRLVFRHLYDQSLVVGGQSASVATVLAPRSVCEITGDAVFTGRVQAEHLRLSGRARVSSEGTPSNPGLLADETIEVRDSAVVTASGGTALLASNSASTLTISIEDTAIVRGDAMSGPGGDAAIEVRVEPGAQLSGTRSSLWAPVTIFLPAAPSWGSAGEYRISGSRRTVLRSDLECGNLLISEDGILEIEGSVTIVAAGTVRVQDRGQILLQPGARLTLWVQGDCIVLGEGRVNAGGDPRKVSINLVGARADLVDRAELRGQVVGPSASMSLSGTAEFFGSCLVQRLAVQGRAQVHYDRPTAPSAVAWIEQN